MKTKSFFSLNMRLSAHPLAGRIVAAALMSSVCLSLYADGPAKPPSKFKDFAEVTKDTVKYEGLFTLYKTNEEVYAEVKQNQFDQPILAPIAIARGLAMAGQPLNIGDEWIMFFRRVDDNVQLLRRNIHYEAAKGSPLEKAVQQN